MTALLPSMMKRRSGHIVAVSSVQGKLALPFRLVCIISYVCSHVLSECKGCMLRMEVLVYMYCLTDKCFRSCYSASKHALQGFYDSLRAEVADSNVQVSIISPGYINTNLSLNAVTQDGSTYGSKFFICSFSDCCCYLVFPESYTLFIVKYFVL